MSRALETVKLGEIANFTKALRLAFDVLLQVLLTYPLACNVLYIPDSIPHCNIYNTSMLIHVHRCITSCYEPDQGNISSFN